MHSPSLFILSLHPSVPLRHHPAPPPLPNKSCAVNIKVVLWKVSRSLTEPLTCTQLKGGGKPLKPALFGSCVPSRFRDVFPPHPLNLHPSLCTSHYFLIGKLPPLPSTNTFTDRHTLTTTSHHYPPAPALFTPPISSLLHLPLSLIFQSSPHFKDTGLFKRKAGPIK